MLTLTTVSNCVDIQSVAMQAQTGCTGVPRMFIVIKIFAHCIFPGYCCWPEWPRWPAPRWMTSSVLTSSRDSTLIYTGKLGLYYRYVMTIICHTILTITFADYVSSKLDYPHYNYYDYSVLQFYWWW